MPQSATLACAVCLACLAAIGCGGDEKPGKGPRADRGQGSAERPRQSSGQEKDGRSPPPRERPQAAAERAVRSYLGALNAHDAARTCALLLPGALARARLQRGERSCEAALDRRLGRPGAHGEPAWKGSRIRAIQDVQVAGSRVRVTVSLRHRLAGTTGEVPVEEDVIYLRRRGARWLVVKPSATLYRALAAGDVPVEALTPP